MAATSGLFTWEECVIGHRLAKELGIRLTIMTGWTVNLQQPDVEICVHVNDEFVTVGIPFASAPLSKRSYILDPGLRSTVSWIMANLADIQTGNCVLDPMCGKATILVEAAREHAHGNIFFGCDLDNQQLQAAMRNVEFGHLPGRVGLLQADALNVPLESATVDRIVCDAPFGQKFKTASLSLPEFYTKLLCEMHRLLVPGGRAVLLTSQDLLPVVESNSQRVEHEANSCDTSAGSSKPTAEVSTADHPSSSHSNRHQNLLPVVKENDQDASLSSSSSSHKTVTDVARAVKTADNNPSYNDFHQIVVPVVETNVHTTERGVVNASSCAVGNRTAASVTATDHNITSHNCDHHLTGNATDHNITSHNSDHHLTGTDSTSVVTESCSEETSNLTKLQELVPLDNASHPNSHAADRNTCHVSSYDPPHHITDCAADSISPKSLNSGLPSYKCDQLSSVTGTSGGDYVLQNQGSEMSRVKMLSPLVSNAKNLTNCEEVLGDHSNAKDLTDWEEVLGDCSNAKGLTNCGEVLGDHSNAKDLTDCKRILGDYSNAKDLTNCKEVLGDGIGIRANSAGQQLSLLSSHYVKLGETHAYIVVLQKPEGSHQM